MKITLEQEIARRLAVKGAHDLEPDPDVPGRLICTGRCGFTYGPSGYLTPDDVGLLHCLYAGGVQLDLQRGGRVDDMRGRIDCTGWEWIMVGGHGHTTPPSGFLFSGKIFAVSPAGNRYPALPGPVGIAPCFYVYTHGLGVNLVQFG